MSPTELRAFRESLHLSRREFAPKLFISKPTLERWERGQGEPRGVHKRILQHMQERTGAGCKGSSYNYDAGESLTADDSIRHLIIETLKGLGVVLLEDSRMRGRYKWSLRFRVGRTTMGGMAAPEIVCEGSDHPLWPAVDFTLVLAVDPARVSKLSEAISSVCYRHGVSWMLAARGRRRSLLNLRQRLFIAGCNPKTIKNAIGNFQSCRQRLP